MFKPIREEKKNSQNYYCCLRIIIDTSSIQHTFLSWPPLASNFPSDEKWQQITLLVLALVDRISVNANPADRKKKLLQSDLLKFIPVSNC